MFTSREYEIIKLIAQGLPSRAIADRLCVSIETIKSHRKNIIRKTQDPTNRRMSLLEFAIAYEKDPEKSL
jgi:DNA-binding CsgD family transcriptional regulator